VLSTNWGEVRGLDVAQYWIVLSIASYSIWPIALQYHNITSRYASSE
jgi:hypothetical protein